MIFNLLDQFNKEIKEVVKECDTLDISLDIAFVFLKDASLKNPDKKIIILDVYDEHMDTPLFALDIFKETDDNNEVSDVYGISLLSGGGCYDSYDDYNPDETLILNNMNDFFKYLKDYFKESNDILLTEIAEFRHLRAIIKSILSDSNNLEEFITNYIKLVKEGENISVSFTPKFKQKLKCK